MATGSADVVLSLGADSSALVADLRNATNEAARAGRSIGAGFAPANQAVKDLGSTIRSYRTEQTQQARTVSFFVRELTDVTGMSKEAGAAVGGLGQVMLEAASGGGAFAIGFEAAKFAVTQIIAEWRRAGEELKALESIQLGVTASLMAGKEALAKLTAAPQTEGDKAFRAVFDEASKGIKGVSDEIEKLREKGPGMLAWVRIVFGDGAGLAQFEATLARASQSIETITNNASNQAEIARALAQEGQKAAQALAANKVLADDYAKSRAAAAKSAADEAREQARIAALIGSTMDRMGDAAAADRGNFPDMFYSQATADQLKKPETVVDAASADRGNFPDMVDAAAELKAFNAESAKTNSIMGTIGESIGSAFGSIGTIVGGAAGQFLKIVGSMIQQAVQLAIAMSTAAMSWSTPLGALAIGASVMAGLLGLISQVPSFDVGTLSVPRTGLAMVHQGEAILPAGGPAEDYRAGVARSGGRGATTVHVNLNVTAMDGQSVYRTLNASRDQLARVVREAVRDGVMG